MTKYEHDLIYRMIPGLTNAIESLTKKLKRYNDFKENVAYCHTCGKIVIKEGEQNVGQTD